MSCTACGHENRPGRKFCVACGAALAQSCAACGSPVEAGENFCGECGAPLAPAAPRRPVPETPRPAPPETAANEGRAARDAGARKIVTIVFADLVGSTALHERVDAESARRLMERYYLALRRAVEAHGGTVVKLLGDGVMAAFGLDRVAEDDALRAVRAAAAMQEAFRGLVRAEGAALGSVGLRVAVNTGEVVVTGAADDVIGDPVNVAARLQEQGSDGDVVIGEATQRLVVTRVTLAPLGSITLKGRAEAVAAHRLVSLDPPAGAAAAPFVGRDAELARLESVFDAAVTTPATRLAVLVGSPGLGKSRLIDELARRHADDATILAAHCDAAGGATFAPLAQVLRRFLGLAEDAAGARVRTAVAAALANGADDGERTRIAAGIDGLLTGAATSPEETFFVVRRFLAGLAAVRPVVLVVDDLHWAEPLLLDLVEHLVQWGSGVPLFVLVGARPELRELRSSLVTPGGIVGDVVMLGGLDAGAAMRLAAGVIGAADLPAAVAAKVLATSEGNPLFVGELVRMLVQEGALTREGDRWTAGANLAALEMPPTIHALLAARIERLRPEERAVLERAAVVGRHFSRSAVAALLGRNGGPAAARDTSDLDARLESLRRSELIERDTGWLLGEPALRFHHVLIRDAAYRRLLKGTRAELHAQLADWIEERVGDAPEHDETIGRHLEQAHQLLRELGPLDAAAVALGERAARRLAAAGRRALARDDVSLAAGLLGRALARLGQGAPERADLVLDWCEALLAAGDVGPAADAIAELDRVAGEAADHGANETSDRIAGATSDHAARGTSDRLGTTAPSTEAGEATRDGHTDPRRLRAWHTCFAGQLTVLTAPEALNATAEQVGAAARELAALDDAAGEAKAHFVHAQALARLGKVGACEAALDHALAAARRAGDRRRANAVLAGAPLAALWGPSPVTRASGRCLDVVRVLRITQGAPAVEAVALSCQGVLEALRGRTEAARRMLASSRAMVEELGIAHRLYETDVFAGRVDLLEDDARAAERSLRAGYEGLRDLGLGIDAARAAALLGRALLAQGRPAEAETLSHESELLAGDDLQAAIAWRGVRAEALARRGEHAAAIAFAEAAVAIAAATDALLDHADARLALAAAFRAAGRVRDGDAEERRALELWEAKGATLLVERTRRADAPVAAASVAPPPRSAPALRRRLTANRATEALVACNAAMAAADCAAFRAQLSEDYEEIDHPTGASYGRDANVAALELLMRSRDARCHNEPLATLGDALVLLRRRVSASATGGGRFDVGAYEQEAYTVAEVDARGRWCRQEVFGGDRLGDALVRFYERHAELLPEGAERTRAAGMARALPATNGPPDLDLLRTTYDPSFRCVDRRVFATWKADSAEEMVRHYRLQLDLAPDFAGRYDDVLAATADTIATRMTFFGTGRDSGGRFENHITPVFRCGADGRLNCIEVFEGDQIAEALACFDELTGSAPQWEAGAAPRPARPPRAPRANAVTRVSAEFEALVAARNFAALETFFATDAECIDHPTGATYGAAAMATGMRRLMRSPDASLRFVPLATLGDSWGLVRREMSASGLVGRHFDMGAYEIVDIAVYGTDEHGRLRHVEIFAIERLGAAIARLYERRAEDLHDAAEAVRARGIARSLAMFDGPIDFDGVARANAASVEVGDHRVLGTWSAHGREQWLAHWRGQFGLADDSSGRYDEILGLAPAALLAHQTFSGSIRTSGGAFENVALVLHVFDADGLIARTELFEPGRTADALARFDALTGAAAATLPVRGGARPPRGLRANRALETTRRFEAAFAAADQSALARLFHANLTVVDHQNGATYGRDGHLASVTRLLRAQDPELRAEALATLGEDLVLWRRRIRASGTSGGRFDVGEFQREEIVIFGVGADGTVTTIEVFAGDRLCQALARLYALYAESLPDGPERTRAAGIARTHSVWDPPLDVDRVMSVMAPSYVCVDHRSLGTWSSRGYDEAMQHWRGQTELAAGFSRRDDDILAFAPAANVMRHTYYGTSRASGGPFENVILAVNVFDADGRCTRAELFEPDEEARALARFNALTGAAAPTLPVRRDGRPPRAPRANAATRTCALIEAAFARRDLAAVDALLGDPLETIEHPTATRYGRAGQLESSRRMMRLPDLDVRIEPLATLGDALCLSRRVVRASGTAGGRFDVGAFELESLIVNAVDSAGRLTSAEVFAGDRLCQALARLYALYAESLPDGAERARAAGIARSHAVMGETLDADRIADVLTGSFACIDHRSLGTWSTEGRDEHLRHYREQAELAAGFSRRDEDLLAFTPSVHVMRSVYFGTSRVSGGPFENVMLALYVFDADGRYARAELFEPEQEAQALARFDTLVGATATPAATPPCDAYFVNAAARADRDLFARFNARDWAGIEALAGPDLVFDERRRLVRNSCGRAVWLEQFRVLYDVPASRFTTELRATRGERLALSLHRFAGEVAHGGGPLAMDDHLVLHEVDHENRITLIVLFDLEDEDAAYAELDARYEVGEGAIQPRLTNAFRRAIADRNWEAITAMCGPGFSEHDHRSLAVLGTSHDAETWANNFRALVDLAPDTVARIEHVRPCPRGALWKMTWVGSREGGRYEIPLLGVSEADSTGKVARIDFYDPERLDQALARFAELAAPTPPAEPFANAATRALDRVARVTAARDWEGLADTCAASLRFDDRRPLFQMELPKEGFLQQHRVLFDVPNARWVMRPIATRGERLTLSQILFQGDVAGGGGALEIDHRGVIEVDDGGRMTAIVLFEPGDLDGAYAELDARWQAGEARAHPRVAAYRGAFVRALADRDWDALAALQAPTLVAHDHRLVGWDELRGPEAYVGALQAMVELAPDAQGRLDHLRTAEHGLLAEVVWVGTRDGGAFESPFLWVLELDETGHAQRLDFYDPHHIDAARARFAEVSRRAPQAAVDRRASQPARARSEPPAAFDRNASQAALAASPARPEAPRDPFAALAKPTLVTAAMDRWRAAYDAGFETGRWEAMRALMAPEYVFDDRRRLVLLRGDVELMLASLRERAASGARAEWTVVGAAGERIAIARMLWSGGPPDGRFEIEYLGVVEVDEAGLIVANVLYDLADSHAARRDAWARWAALDPAVARWTDLVGRSEDGFDAKDREDMAERFSADLLVEDHRRTGLGRLEGFEAYSKSLEALWELAPDQRLETGWFWPAVEPHGIVTSLRRYGTLPDGGAFESDYLMLWVAPAGRITHAEYFERDDIDRAVARLAELRPDPLRIPPNAATRAIERRTAAFEARDWDALRDLCAGALVFEDRRWIARTIGDREMFIASNRLVGDVGAHVVRTVLATAGERLALDRTRFVAGDAGAEIEVETLAVSEIDADERLVAIVFFEPGDRAAFRALAERHLALTRPSALPRLAALIAAGRDLTRLRAALPDDFFFHDHRRTGLGRLDGADAYVASVAALHELAPDAIVGQPLHFLADEPHGTLAIAHSFGTLVDGGAYESVYVMITLYGPDGIAGGELFELEHLDTARARFAELRA